MENQIYGKMGGNYWLLLNNIEHVFKYLNKTLLNKSYNYITKILDIEGGVIAINPRGGYHGGVIEDYTDIVKSDGYPHGSEVVIESFSWGGLLNLTYP